MKLFDEHVLLGRKARRRRPVGLSASAWPPVLGYRRHAATVVVVVVVVVVAVVVGVPGCSHGGGAAVSRHKQ